MTPITHNLTLHHHHHHSVVNNLKPQLQSELFTIFRENQEIQQKCE